jgi:hypothetical protein
MKASIKLMPHHIERTIEPLFNILLSPGDVYWCARYRLIAALFLE